MCRAKVAIWTIRVYKSAGPACTFERPAPSQFVTYPVHAIPECSTAHRSLLLGVAIRQQLN